MKFRNLAKIIQTESCRTGILVYFGSQARPQTGVDRHPRGHLLVLRSQHSYRTEHSVQLELELLVPWPSCLGFAGPERSTLLH